VARRLACFAVLLAVVAFAAGCGGSSSSSDGTSATDDWANGVCSAITTWTNSLKSATSSLKGGNVSKDGLQGVADDLKSANETFVDDLKGLGKPDTEAGQQAKESVDKLAGELQSDSSKIEDAVKDVSGASGVLTAVSVVSTTVVSMGSQLQTTFTELQQLDAKGELETAFEQADACKTLTNSS
jgi:hypothetical protein